MKLKYLVICALLLCACDNSKTEKTVYPDQIGDTSFDAALDNPNFKFCNADQVLHKRALIKYQDGNKGLEKNILQQYKMTSKFQAFSGYVIVRFAINCEDQIGRIRLEVLDKDFNIIQLLKEWKLKFGTLLKT